MQPILDFLSHNQALFGTLFGLLTTVWASWKVWLRRQRRAAALAGR